jgi:putative redox protein
MSFTATSRRAGPGLRTEVDVNGRHLLVTDEPESLGGKDSAPAPHELLPAMLAACVSTMIDIYAQKRGWDVGAVRVDVDYDPESTPRRCVVRIHFPDHLAPGQRRRLERVAATCPVRRALESGFEFEEEILPSRAA